MPVKYFSIIIAYYKNIDALELIIRALIKQSYANFEIIIAEDNVASEFTFLCKVPVNQTIKHVYQSSDDGFRKNKILNKALDVSAGDWVIFIDGDCIPQRHFVSAYNRHLTDFRLCFGRRIMLSQSITKKLYAAKDLSQLNFLQFLSSGSKKLKYTLYIPQLIQQRDKGVWGHNWGIKKSHLVEVNGFDEDYQTAGVGEDVDIEWRLKSIGVKLFSIRYAAIQYHLYHTENYSIVDVQTGMAQLTLKQQKNQFWAQNGLVKKLIQNKCFDSKITFGISINFM
ncbi:MAG: glycosyltransferase [Saprospiraceae bacterium]|nr:glycosyltransferase [Saprospiraceae bacterium]